MKLAFCLFNYFPFGGLQRDFVRIAQACLQRGHQIEVFTMHWEGEHDPRLKIHIIPVAGWQNHTQAQHFVKQIKPCLKNFDLVVGFNKMPGLDVYYAADTCFQAKSREKHGFLYRLTPRYCHLVNYEKKVFNPQAKTKILLIAPNQQAAFTKFYETPAKRFYILPPGIAQDRLAPKNAQTIRKTTRQEFNIAPNEFLLLMVGSGFKTKGLDRILVGLSALPPELKKLTKLFIIGADTEDPFVEMANQLDIQHQVNFLGGRADVPRFFLAADLLVHPAYFENTGTVLLEALAAGLPVLTTDVCGYAHYVEKAQAGIVLKSPFSQKEFNETLATMLKSPLQTTWQKNGLSFAKTTDIYSLPEKAADVIESLK